MRIVALKREVFVLEIKNSFYRRIEFHDRQFARTFNQQFPGFETDIHGLAVDRSGGGLRYFVDCVTQG